MKQIVVDFLYLDLNTCERCIATDETLKKALDVLSGAFDTLGYQVKVNSVNITSRELAEEYRLISSPTIRVNGVDICSEVKENECKDCGDLCGDNVDCRVFVYEGKHQLCFSLLLLYFFFLPFSYCFKVRLMNKFYGLVTETKLDLPFCFRC